MFAVAMCTQETQEASKGDSVELHFILKKQRHLPPAIIHAITPAVLLSFSSFGSRPWRFPPESSSWCSRTPRPRNPRSPNDAIKDIAGYGRITLCVIDFTSKMGISSVMLPAALQKVLRGAVKFSLASRDALAWSGPVSLLAI